MLNLASDTNKRWLEQVDQHLEEILIDHAHCEKKAAGVAMNLMFAYVDKPELCRELSEIVNEELDHFMQVLDILADRGIEFRKLKPSLYGRELNDLVRKQEPYRAVDRMLVACIIEARSCERFCMLKDHIQERDPELAEFYGSLFESEARHHTTYVRMAKLFQSDQEVKDRLKELAAKEAELIREVYPLPRMHS